MEATIVFYLKSLNTDGSKRYLYSAKAFIFSLRNNEGLSPFKSTLQYRWDLGHWARKWAILNVEASGPHFGGANDLSLMEQGCAYEERRSRSTLGSFYTAPSGARDRSTILAGSATFYPDEVEVFYAV